MCRRAKNRGAVAYGKSGYRRGKMIDGGKEEILCIAGIPRRANIGRSWMCVLLGVSFGANIVDFVARNAVDAVKLIESVKIVAQVLMYPFFAGTVPTHFELKLAG
ncbi:hypothetical protein ZIOFF_042481 [Zingiber officinale]|uniref:Uncharacterized protein n=1 Tax=Zingiber officinale TaxID=94328 RepID=A0A8J5FRQ5_ZINOF|nr:hypothetical protein ZIOFF_042481 [Zingiber officinale]